MVLSKTSVLIQNNVRDQKEIEEIIKDLDARLLKFNGVNPIEVQFDQMGSNEQVRTEIVRLYRVAGWDINLQGRCEGYYYWNYYSFQ